MALALPLVVELFQSVQTVVDWLAGGPAPRRDGIAALTSLAPPVQPLAQPGRPQQRVVHVVNASESRRAAGMVISGRIDEVCAELDRLAALDSAH